MEIGFGQMLFEQSDGAFAAQLGDAEWISPPAGSRDIHGGKTVCLQRYVLQVEARPARQPQSDRLGDSRRLIGLTS